MSDRPPIPTALKWTFGIPFAILCLGFPIAMTAVFFMDGDRVYWSGFLSLCYLIGFYGMFAAPWWPLHGLRGRPRKQKLETTVVIWLWAVYLTAMIWELPYLLFADVIKAAKDEMWAYTWWAWIDGGDIRYTGFDPTIFTLEMFTVANAFAGLAALVIWLRRDRRPLWPLFVFMFTGASHCYQTLQYYVTQALVGFEAVGDSWFDLYVKFILVNSPWVVMPICVWIWAFRKIRNQTGAELVG